MKDKAYLAIIGELEQLEADGLLTAHAHHLAQRLSERVAIACLPPIQKSIYDQLPATSQEISVILSIGRKVELETKNVSAQLGQLRAKGFVYLKGKKWFKLEIK